MKGTQLSTKEIALTVYFGYSEIVDIAINDNLTKTIKQIRRTLTLRECKKLQSRIPQEELAIYDTWIIILESIFDLNAKIQPLTTDLCRTILDYVTLSLFKEQDNKQFSNDFKNKLESLLFIYFRLFAWNYLLDQTLDEKNDFTIYQSAKILQRTVIKFNAGAKKLGIFEPFSIKRTLKNTLPEINNSASQFFTTLSEIVCSKGVIISLNEIKLALSYASKKITDLFLD